MGIENYLAFITTAIIFIITPGIDTIFILNKCISQGKRAGVYSTFGINTGILVHTIFAALGLSLIVAKSAIAFMIIKYLGAAYLIYLGISKLLTNKNGFTFTNKKETLHTDKQNFVSGLVTNVLNPKVALFFLAFFPQFINPHSINSPTPFVILGLTYACLGVTWFLILTSFAATFSNKLSGNKTAKWLNKFSGIVFILMGVKIALTKK